VSANFPTEPHTCLEDELSVVCPCLGAFFVWVGWLVARVKWGKEGLDNMVAVHISCKFQNVWRELRNQHGYFLTKIIHVGAQYFNEGLDSSGAVDTHRNLHTRVKYWVDYLSELIYLADLDNLLAKVVSKLIHHNIAKEATHRINQSWHESWWCLSEIFKLLLYHSAASLIVSEFVNLTYYVKLWRGKVIQIRIDFI
jgi:hypothetical protein